RRAMLQTDYLGTAGTVVRDIGTDSANAAIFVGQVYHKGAGLLHGLDAALPDGTLLQLLRSALTQYGFGSWRRTAFLEPLVEQHDALAAAFAVELTSATSPAVDVRWACRANTVGIDARLSLHRQQRIPDRLDPESAVPMCVRLDGVDAAQCTVLPASGTTLYVDVTRCPEWVHPNANEDGYYVWRTSADDAQNLVAHAASLTYREQGM